MGKGSAIPINHDEAQLAWLRYMFGRQEAGLGTQPPPEAFDALPHAEQFAWQMAYSCLAMDFNEKRDALWKSRITPLAESSRALCYEIEALPSGEQQTKVSILASNLSQNLHGL